jgi:hypothetical protein
VIESGSRASFHAEPLQRLLVPRKVLGEKLQRDMTAEVQILSLVDYAHATASEPAYDFVVRDSLSDHLNPL